MVDEKFFINKDGTISVDSIAYYNSIISYAKRYNLKNTLIAIDLATTLHEGSFRDGGSPYIIHPLETTNYLILLNVRNAIFDMNLSNLHDEKLAESQTNLDLDILLSSMLLHDTIEDCKSKLLEGGKEFVTKYKLHPDILKFVLVLTKDKTKPGYTLNSYYEQIGRYWQTLIMKIVDRTNNCSSIDAFKEERMEKYVRETTKYFYPMISNGKILYPEFSRIFTIMKYLIVSICESVAAVLNLNDIIVEDVYEKTFFFIKGFAVKGSMRNTLKSLPLANEYYKGLTRKSGDAFIIHPLRVCSYLISLKIDKDIICSVALLHEIIKKCNLEYNGIEILTKYHLDPIILDYIRLLANCEHYPLPLYYEALRECPEVMLLKLSNRAHTCTTLIDSSDDEIREYVDECEKYIYPLCEYGINHYPEHSYSIQVMYYHIHSVCNIVKSLRIS